jgi:hypothetical protein
MYGRAFMGRVRSERKEARRTQPVCPGASGQQTLF